MTDKQNRSKKGQGKIGNNFQSSSKKNWAFTFNNYDPHSIALLQEIFNRIKCKYVFGEEIGEENKTPHLQGQIILAKKQRLTWLKKIDPRIHWSGTRNLSASVDYCQKDGKVWTNMDILNMEPEYVDVVWRPWQQKVVDLINTTPDDRSVYWFWERTGKTGKSFLTRYLMAVKNALVVSGKAGDIFHQIAKRQETGTATDIAILDIPRTYLGFISYHAIENLKNRYIISGKYEGEQYLIKACHVICFANEPPEIEKMSLDRWVITEIQDAPEIGLRPQRRYAALRCAKPLLLRSPAVATLLPSLRSCSKDEESIINVIKS